MKTKLIRLTVLSLALAGLTARAQPEPNADPSQEPTNGGPPHRPPPIGIILSGLLDKYDANKDGQLDQTELAALKADIANGKIGLPPAPGGPGRPGGPPPLPKEILDKYDVNHDGKLDASERAALQRDVEDGKVQLPAGLHPGGPPPSAKDIIAKYDTDQDGKLNETELAAFLKDMRAHRPPPPPGPGAPFPGQPDGGVPPDAPQQ